MCTYTFCVMDCGHTEVAAALYCSATFGTDYDIQPCRKTILESTVMRRGRKRERDVCSRCKTGVDGKWSINVNEVDVIIVPRCPGIDNVKRNQGLQDWLVCGAVKSMIGGEPSKGRKKEDGGVRLPASKEQKTQKRQDSARDDEDVVREDWWQLGPAMDDSDAEVAGGIRVTEVDDGGWMTIEGEKLG